MATLEAEDLTKLAVGATIKDERLDTPQVIRELEVIVENSTVRAYAWCGTVGSPMGRIPRLLTALVKRIIGARIYGKHEYRVVDMAADGRVNLQSIDKESDIPDLLPVDIWPGLAGSHSNLEGGASVLVEFINGDRDRPIVTSFAPKGARGFVPSSTVIGPDGTASEAARKGDTVKILLPPQVFNGTIGGSPAAGVVASLTGYTLGTIMTGSPSGVKIG
jgi:hypothetical protein